MITNAHTLRSFHQYDQSEPSLQRGSGPPYVALAGYTGRLVESVAAGKLRINFWICITSTTIDSIRQGSGSTIARHY